MRTRIFSGSLLVLAASAAALTGCTSPSQHGGPAASRPTAHHSSAAVTPAACAETRSWPTTVAPVKGYSPDKIVATTIQRQACADRLSFVSNGKPGGYEISYIKPSQARIDGIDDPVPGVTNNRSAKVLLRINILAPLQPSSPGAVDVDKLGNRLSPLPNLGAPLIPAASTAGTNLKGVWFGGEESGPAGTDSLYYVGLDSQRRLHISQDGGLVIDIAR
jgi:hypothetical protein